MSMYTKVVDDVGVTAWECHISCCCVEWDVR